MVTRSTCKGLNDLKTLETGHVSYLSDADAKLASVIASVGTLRNSRRSGFEIIAGSIIHQQLSKSAANEILRRLRQIAPRLDARYLSQVSDHQLRECGLARRKIGFLRTLVGAVDSGRVSFRRLRHMSDNEISEKLVALKGIGPWTVDMFLIFGLNRPDVFPSADAGLLAAMRDVYHLSKSNPRSDYEEIAEKWRPYRSVAARYLWAYRDAKPL